MWRVSYSSCYCQPVGVARRLIKRMISTCFSLYKSLGLVGVVVDCLLPIVLLFWVVYLDLVISCETCSVWLYTILCQTEIVLIFPCFLVLYTFPFLMLINISVATLPYLSVACPPSICYGFEPVVTHVSHTLMPFEWNIYTRFELESWQSIRWCPLRKELMVE